MSKQKRKFPATATPDKTRQDKPLVELSKEQLEAIAAGITDIDEVITNHNETMVSSAQLNC